MDPGKDKEGVPQPAGPPARKKFVIPLAEDAVPPAVAKPLFKSTKNLPTVDTSAQAAPQTYAEYVMSRPAGGPGATCPTGSEPLAGETPNQAPKPGAKSNSIIVSPRQLRYHNLHPDYIHARLQSLGKTFALRVLLVQVDVKDPQQALKELAKMCILADCTLILAWSPEEAGRYLETYKAYEQKPADLLMEKLEQDFVSRSLEQLIAASREDLALCPGLGPQKARRLFDVLHEPFLKVPR
uniref:ERCC excision repair 1, endonuclease non-catalytic subunit n=1 Tax=Saimiri boliviensis boliviensis TaxID=39432 RepID=A0A2K6V181_SAIBB